MNTDTGVVIHNLRMEAKYRAFGEGKKTKKKEDMRWAHSKWPNTAHVMNLSCPTGSFISLKVEVVTRGAPGLGLNLIYRRG